MLFSHPAMLWALLAVAVPVIIHLFNIRRYRKVYFSNVDALQELHSENRRRSDVRRWLVLLMRMLAVALLVLAFAGPVVPSREQALRSGATVVSIYLDNTFSMEGTTPDGTQLEAAKRKAREVAAAYGTGDRYQLLTADMSGHQMRWLSRDELLDAIDDVQPTPAVATLAAVATRQITFMAQSGAANRHAYIISDFQQSTSDLDAMPSDSAVLFTLVPLTGTVADNIYIDTLHLDAPAYYVGGRVAVEATIVNGGSHDVEKLPVKLYVDGRERALATVDMPAGTAAKATLLFTIDSGGWHTGHVEIEDYPVTYDDIYHFALNVGDRLAVLEVDDGDANAALQRLFATDTAVTLSHTRLLSQQQVQQADLVVLNEPRRLTSGDAEWLAEWVEAGGTLLVIPPADGAQQALDEMLTRLHAPRLGRWQQRTSRASAIDYDNGLYRGVFNGRNDEMEMPTVQGHYAYADAQAMHQSIITLADGGDLLCVTPCGDGRLYLFTTPLDGDHTDLTAQALFVPTLYNMALYSRRQPAPCHTLGDNTPIELQGRYDLATSQPELTDGDAVSVVPDLRNMGGHTMLVPHDELPHDGIYRLGDERLAFNLGRRESQLSFLAPSDVAKAIEGHHGYTMLQPTERPLDQVLHERQGGRHLWRLCLLLALAALVAETALLKIGVKS